MSLTIQNGIPKWLSAYPNEGALDYFGGRFYRQPHRAYLVRGAAANDFRNAKTLIFYSALCFAFRKEHDLDAEAELDSATFAEWQRWFMNANFLYVVNHYARYRSVPDRGFTGAQEAFWTFFDDFFEGKTTAFEFDDVYSSFYPEQRQWGYLAQFWRAPMHYFRTVLSINECSPGEYGRDCYDLLSSYEGWPTFLSSIRGGLISSEALSEVQDVIDCKHLSADEQRLADSIIFDKRRVTGEENDSYKVSFNLVNGFLENGFEGASIKEGKQLAALFTYRHLKNDPVEHDQEYWWRIVIASLAFDCGIHRLYSHLGELAIYDVLDSIRTKEFVRSKVGEWLEANGHGDHRLSRVCQEWTEKHLRSFHDFNALYERLVDYDDLETFIDGLLIGYLVSSVQLPNEITHSEGYFALTDDYHHFVPRAFFRRKIDKEMDFSDFIEEVAFRLIEEQFEFSIDRMGFGQKAKFILVKDEVTGNYIFQIDARKFYENQGIINMIDACLALWGTAGMIEV